MCLTKMEAKPKHIKTYYLFQNTKPGSRKLLRVTPEDDEALKLRRTSPGTATNRKSLRSKRSKLAKLEKVLGVLVNTRKAETVREDLNAAACALRHPEGAMAPQNTTQYLMGNVYDDMRTSAQAEAASHSTSAHIYCEALSPGSVYAALDSDYELCLAYQQRDFEELYGLSW